MPENLTAEQIAAKEAAEKEAADKLAAEKEAAEKARLAGLTQEQRDAERIEKLAAEKAAAQLKEIKENLDKSYAARDAAEKKAAALEKEKRDAELKRLEEEGKHKEAADLRIAERDAEIKALKEQNTTLSRDVAVREALRSLDFRNTKAADIAFNEITSEMVKDAAGNWIHKSGVNVLDYVNTTFARAEDSQFLFKPKSSGGGGTNDGSGDTGKGAPAKDQKSLFAMKQSDVIKMAQEGKLGNGGNTLPY
jgi:hypothetical protein